MNKSRNRLTRKIKGANNYCEFELKDQPYKSFLDIKRNSDLEWLDVCDLTLAIDKLGQLEDIEKELGIDLITLGKALINGVYCKGIPWILRGICIHTKDDIGVGFVDDRELFNEIPVLHLWSYYGKTWALTKEELENG